MKTLIWARVSTNEQDRKDISIPAQLERTTEYAQRRGFKIDLEIPITETASKDEMRKQFNEVLSYIEKSKEKVVLIIDTVDRITRNFVDAVALDKLRKKGKVELHFLREGLIVHQDSNSSEIMRWDMAVMFAKNYSLQISDNVKRSFEHKRNNKQYPHPAPFGYENITKEDSKKWIIPDEDTAHIVKQIFHWRGIEQISFQAISKSLMKKYKINRSKGSVELLIKNPFYYGMMRIKGKLYPHDYEPLITKSLYNKSQETSEQWHKKPFKYASLPFTYRGLVKCQTCGCTITPEKKKGKYTYYHCTKYHGNCNGKWVPEGKFNTQVMKELISLQIPDDILEWLVQELQKTHVQKNKTYDTEVSRLKRQHTQIENMLKEMYKDRLVGRITPDEYDKMLGDYKNEQADLLSKINDYDEYDRKYYMTASRLLELLSRAKMIFESSEAMEKRQLLNYLLQNFSLEGEKLHYDLKNPYSMIASYIKRQAWLRGQDSNL